MTTVLGLVWLMSLRNSESWKVRFGRGTLGNSKGTQKCCETAVGICSFLHKSISAVKHCCQTRRSGVQSAFQFIPKVLVDLRSGLCEGHLSSSTPVLVNHVFIGALTMSMLEQVYVS